MAEQERHDPHSHEFAQAIACLAGEASPIVAMVRAAGAREVHMRVSSPPITGPCYYGIDTPRREELIAANFPIPEIARRIGVDSLGYLSLEGMLKAVPGGPDGFCHACFSGDYPTPPPRDANKLRFVADG